MVHILCGCGSGSLEKVAEVMTYNVWIEIESHDPTTDEYDTHVADPIKVATCETLEKAREWRMILTDYSALISRLRGEKERREC